MDSRKGVDGSMKKGKKISVLFVERREGSFMEILNKPVTSWSTDSARHSLPN